MSTNALSPLDRVLIAQAARDVRMPGHWDDWCYFLGYAADGRLMIASANGRQDLFAQADVQKVEKRVPVTVRAVTKSGWNLLERARRARIHYVPQYVTAKVLVAKVDDVSNAVYGFHIRFPDGDERPLADHKSIHPADFDRVAQRLSEGIMPIVAVRGFHVTKTPGKRFITISDIIDLMLAKKSMPDDKDK